MDSHNEMIYSEKNLNKIRNKYPTWWIIHSDEHPTGKRHIGYLEGGN